MTAVVIKQCGGCCECLVFADLAHQWYGSRLTAPQPQFSDALQRSPLFNNTTVTVANANYEVYIRSMNSLYSYVDVMTVF